MTRAGCPGANLPSPALLLTLLLLGGTGRALPSAVTLLLLCVTVMEFLTHGSINVCCAKSGCALRDEEDDLLSCVAAEPRRGGFVCCWGGRDSCWQQTLPVPWPETPAAELPFRVNVGFWGPRAVFCKRAGAGRVSARGGPSSCRELGAC